MINISDKIIEAKQEGRRLYKIKFIDLYGWDSFFIIQTLNRGEILKSFEHAGYPGRNIPEKDTKAQALLENKLLIFSCLQVPEEFDIRSCPAGLPQCIAKLILDNSGFIENSKTQKEILRLAAEFSNSPEGKGDGLILHTIPSITLYDLESMDTSTWSKYLTLAINIQKDFYGREENILNYLDPGSVQYKEREPQRDRVLDQLTIPDRVPGLNQFATQDKAEVFKSTNNLSVKDGQKILNILGPNHAKKPKSK